MSARDFVTKDELQQLRTQVQDILGGVSGQIERINIQESNVNVLRDTRGTLTENLSGEGLNITNVEDFSAQNGKFRTLKVNDVEITGNGGGGGGGSSGIFIQDDGAVTEASRDAGAQAITILNFAGEGVTVGGPEDAGAIGETTFKQTITIPSLSLKFNDNVVTSYGATRTLDFRGSAVTSVADTGNSSASTHTAAITIDKFPGTILQNNGAAVVSGTYPFAKLNLKGTAITSIATNSSDSTMADITIDQASSSGPTVSAINANNSALGSTVNNTTTLRFQGDIINTVTEPSTGFAAVEFRAPETKANSVPGPNIKNLLDADVRFQWDKSGDLVAGTAQYDKFGGQVPGAPSDTDHDAFQAASCVALSYDGKFMVVSAPGATHGTDNEGYIKLYCYKGGDWAQLGRRVGPADDALGQDTANNHGRDGKYGFSVAINGDASFIDSSNDDKQIIVMVGEPEFDGSKGNVFFYRYNNTSGNLEIDDSSFGSSSPNYLTAASVTNGPTLASGSKLGHSVALNNLGKIAAAGSPLNTSTGGSAIVYSRGAGFGTTGNWTITHVIGAHGPGAPSGVGFAEPNFGFSVSLDEDGNILAVTNREVSGSTKGRIKVYQLGSGNVLTNNFSLWGVDSGGTTQNDLVGRDGDYLGWSVKLSGDGNTVVAGSIDHKSQTSVTEPSSRTGIVRIWSKGGNSDSSWVEHTSIEPKFMPTGGHSNPPGGRFGDADSTDNHYNSSRNSSNGSFGSMIALSNDGKIIAVGASRFPRPHANIGFVRAYYYSGDGTTNTWDQLGGTINGSGLDAFFGRCISFNKDGTKLAITSPYDDDHEIPAGSASAYRQVEISRHVGSSNAGIAQLYQLNTGMNPLDIRRLTSFFNHFT